MGRSEFTSLNEKTPHGCRFQHAIEAHPSGLVPRSPFGFHRSPGVPSRLNCNKDKPAAGGCDSNLALVSISTPGCNNKHTNTRQPKLVGAMAFGTKAIAVVIRAGRPIQPRAGRRSGSGATLNSEFDQAADFLTLAFGFPPVQIRDSNSDGLQRSRRSDPNHVIWSQIKSQIPMKKIQTLIPRLLFVSLVAALAGCASANYQKGAGTAAGLTASADKIAAGKGKIETTLAVLNDLVTSPQGDLVPKFKKYTSAVKDLQSTASEVKSKYEAMRDGGNDYFKAWDEQLAQIKNEDLKTRSAERKTEVMQKFADIKRSYTEASVAFTPFMNNLKDVETVLSTDLTTGGIESIKGIATQLNTSGSELMASVDKLATQFRELGVAMAASAPAPAPATK